MGVSSLGLNGRRVGLHKLLSVSDERTSALRFSGSKRDGLHSTHFAPPGLVTIDTRSGQCAAAPLAVAWSGGIVVCDKSNPPGSFIMDGKAFLIFGTAISILAAVPAHAAQLEFDCDVPADRFSSVSQDVANGGSVAMRQGSMLRRPFRWPGDTASNRMRKDFAKWQRRYGRVESLRHRSARRLIPLQRKLTRRS